MELRADDAFWAARRVMAFSDELIRAAVHTGQFSDPAAERHLAAVLIKRRDAIGRTYLTAINPVVNPRLDAAGALTFENAAVAAGVADAAGRLSRGVVAVRQRHRRHPADRRDPQRHHDDPAAARPADRRGRLHRDRHLRRQPSHPSWRQPVRTFFRRTAAGWTLVGLERLPDQPAGAAAGPGR